MRILPLTFLLTACGPGLMALGDPREEPAAPGGPPADPSDPDSDSDSTPPVQSESTESAESELTPHDPIIDGPFSGSVQLNLNASGATGTCAGTANLTVDRSRSPAIQGTATCETSGLIRTLGLVDASYDGVIRGDITTTPNATGEVTVGTLLPTAAQWDGFFAGSGQLQGTIRGVSGVPPLNVDLDGTFSLRPN
ncbi:MAG: hypothetical protein EA397_00900 [Deltaproteobacteria bacterium]|nr:MAG: hypothetical protein EA397_00900 [Deltaproteobacteria bacterium]